MSQRFWVGGGSTDDWDATGPTNWGTSSGTQDDASVPGATDDVIFDSGLDTSTLSANISIKSLDCTGFGGTITHDASVVLTIAGDLLRLSSAMTYTLGDGFLSQIKLTSTTGTAMAPTTITTFGKTLPNLTLNGSGGYFKLGGDLTMTITSPLTLTTGTFDTGNYNVTAASFQCSGASARTVLFGSSTINLNGLSTAWNTAVTTNLTFTPGTSTVVIGNPTAGSKTFNGGGVTFNNLTIATDNIFVLGNNTYNVFGISNAGGTIGIKMTAGTTHTVTDITCNGSSGNLAKILSDTGGSAFTFSAASGTISIDYVSLKDSTASGGATFYAGANSTDVSGNTGWIFSNPLASSNAQNLLLMGVG